MEVHKKEKKKTKKHDLCVISMENQVFVDPVRYYATHRYNPRSDFYKNGPKSSARLKGKKRFQCEKMSTSADTTKNVGGLNPICDWSQSNRHRKQQEHNAHQYSA